ncbi:hypothetical protein TNCV_1960641 [Trichonephila clavipes]|nr:hypothetical protein TNCV_1960641 [Trichonephila clavipes]
MPPELVYPSPNYHTARTGGLSFNMQQPPLHFKSSVASGLEAVTRRSRVWDHNLQATAATFRKKVGSKTLERGSGI